jgi:predicted GTPase
VASDEARRWAVGYAVRRAGKYAIQLYSGEMAFNDLTAEERVTSRSRKELATDLRRADAESSEPLRVLVIGQTKAGKSSLINALFGKTVAAVGPAPLTDEVTAYRLEREGIMEGLVLDSPGYEVAGKRPEKQQEALLLEVEACDIVLVVCAATSAAREADRRMLDRLRQRFVESPQRTPPALLVVLTHIDLLRPRSEWNPPYNIAQPTTPKEQTIREAMEAVAADLGVPVERVTPVCSAPGEEYNVHDGLAAAIAASLDDAHRAKYFRCLSDLRDAEFWQRLGEQAKSSGKMLAQVGMRWLSEAGKRVDDWSRPLTDRENE